MEEKGPERGRGCKCAKEFGFLLWTMGSQGVVVNIRFAFWRDPCGCCVEDGASY